MFNKFSSWFARGLTGAVALAVTAGVLVCSPAPAFAEEPVVNTDALAIPAASGNAEVDGQSLQVLAQLPATATDPFQLVGVTWTAQTGPDLVVQFRTLANGVWSEWQKTEGSKDTDEGRGGTEPIYTGKSTGVEIRVLGQAGATVTGVKASLIDPEQVAQDAFPTRVTAQAASPYVARPQVISRAQWGADESLLSYNGSSCVPANYDRTIKAVIVHHTEGSNSYTKDQSASIVRGIYRYHVVNRGWCDIGYNMLVDKYGQIFEGRHGGVDYPVHGAHASSWNTDTFGISVMMNSMTAPVTAESMNSLTQAIAWKLAGNYRTPLDKVTLAGKTINRIAMHKDVMATDCPGTNLTALMPTLRNRVASTMGSIWKTEIYTKWQSIGGEAGGFGAPYIVERDLLGGRVADFAGGTIWKRSDGQLFIANAAIAARARRAEYATIGMPSSNAVTRGSGLSMPFANAEVHSQRTTGTYLVSGAVLNHLRANPSLATSLGVAISELTTLSSGWQQQRFESGTLAVSPTGAVMLAPKSLGDRTGDGRADLVMIDQATNGLWWTQTDPTLKAGEPQQLGRGWNAFNWITQLPDQNGDGYSDLLARDDDGGLWLYPSAGPSGFTTRVAAGRGWLGMKHLIVMGDVNRDGRMELYGVTADGLLMSYIMTSEGKLSFAGQVGRGWGTMASLTTVGDFTGKGGVDLLAVKPTGELLAYTFDRTQKSVSVVQVGRGWSGMDLLVTPGDLNDDGRRDLLGRRSSDGGLFVYLNTAPGRWSGVGSMMDASGQRLIA